MTDAASRALIPRRVLAIIGVSLILFILVPIAVVILLVTGQSEPPGPTIPSWLPAVQQEWPERILLPARAPECLTYLDDEAQVTALSAAPAGEALTLHFRVDSTSNCSQVADPDLVMIQAPELVSLEGHVTTVSYQRQQFARTEDETASDDERVTLQWQCASSMCRVSADLGGVLTIEDLLRTAMSVERVS